MPRKATGGKIGRPLKSVSKSLTKKQKAYGKLISSNPKLSQAECARRLGVTRSAVNKWANDPIIADENEREEPRELGRKIAQTLKNKDIKRQAALNEEFARLCDPRNKSANIEVYVENHWEGPTSLFGDDKPIATADEYIEILIKKNLTPKELIDEAVKRAEQKGGFSLTKPRAKPRT
jgi:predicted transcriptional regulator